MTSRGRRQRTPLVLGIAVLLAAAVAGVPTRPETVRRAEAIDPALLARLLPETESAYERTLAAAAFVNARVPAGTTLSAHRYLRAMRQLRRVLPQSAPGGVERQWEFLGPANVGGRIRALAIDPRDPNVMYTGGVAGGVFKSTDAGASWNPITERFGHVAVSSIALDPSNPDIVYVGTGEFNNSRPGVITAGIGVLKTADAGASWRILPSTVTDPNFQVVHDLVVSSNDANRVYAATDAGVVRSIDAGLTWQLVHQGFTGRVEIGCWKLSARTDRNPDEIIATCPYLSSVLFRSVDGGETWEGVLESGGPLATPLGYAPAVHAKSNQNIVYASAANMDDVTAGVLRSDQGGAAGSWTVVSRTPVLNYCGIADGQGAYANAIAVDPTNPERVWIGGIDAWRSEDGGRTFLPVGYWWLHQALGADDGSQYVHADHHAIVFHPDYDGSANQNVYFATDGGLFRTAADRTPATNPDCNAEGSALNPVLFDSLNEGLSITQFWGGAASGDGSILLGGTQDNGTYIRRNGGGPNDWELVHGGDGMKTAITPDGSRFYTENPGFNGIDISRSDTGDHGTFQPITGGILDKGLFVTPFVMDPNDPRTLWTGGSKMWRTQDGGDLWTEVSPVFIQPGFQSAIQSIAVAPSNSDVVYVGTSQGGVWVSTNAKASPPSWTDVTGPLPVGENGYVSSIAVDPTNPAIAYVTHTAFGVPHVWKTTDTGASWTNIDGILPDVPVSAVAVNPRNPQMVFIGTDIGVFESLNGGASWLPSGTNVPGFYIMEMFFRPGTSDLYVYTHSRGVYRVDVGT